MTPYPELYEKLVASRHAQIQYEMQQIRMVHAGQRRTFVRSVAGDLRRLLIVLGSYMQRTGQRIGASVRSS